MGSGGEGAHRPATFAAVPKFVASHSLTAPSWAGTTVVTDVAADVRGIRDRFGETHVFGSGDLVRTLLREDLVDRINLWLYPIALGTGKRLFAEGTVPAAFALVEPPDFTTTPCCPALPLTAASSEKRCRSVAGDAGCAAARS